MTSVLSLIFLVCLRLCLGMSTPLQREKMSFIAQDFEKLNIITVLEGRTQAIIRNYFLKYDRVVRCRVKIITMDMFSPLL